jgi:tetratricopeptide (TPR) repeat protein
MRSRTFAALCVSALAVATFGQQQPPIAPVGPAAATPTTTKPAGPRVPTLLDESGKEISGVRVIKADVKAVVRGPLAEAVVILTFANDTDRVLGGELTFPLPDGATVAGYGLDVNGQLVDGVAVEKQQARVIYEKEMNKTVDPGLVEHVTGNNFRTRLYPIPAHGTRTLKLNYVADLVPSADGRGATLTMPMGLGEKLAALDLTVAVEGATQPPVVRGGSYTSREFEGNPQGYYLKDSLRDAKALDSLTISLPEVPATSAVVQTRQREPITVQELERSHGPQSGPRLFPRIERYFVLTDTPKRPIEKADAKVLKNQRILLVWDASLSRQTADRERELKLLGDALNRLDYPALDIVLLRNDAEVHPFFAAGQAGNDKAIEFLKTVKYDGGTNLGALSIPKNFSGLQARITGPTGGAQPDYDLAILFTDGLSTVGNAKPGKIDLPIYAISADPSSDHASLRALCQSSGGLYLNLNRDTDAHAIEAIGRPPFSIIAVEADPAAVADVTPGVGTAVGGRITVAGKLLANEAKVTLVYGFGKTETGRQTFTLKADEATEGMLIPRFWAQQKAAELATQGESKREELVNLGKEFSLVTPATSLLVLETVEQYVQYGIVPPKSRAEVYQQFTQKIEGRRVEEARTKEQKIQQVLGMWQARTKWWEAKFEYPADLVVKPDGDKQRILASAAPNAPAVHSPRPNQPGNDDRPPAVRPALSRDPAAAPPATPAPAPLPPAEQAPERGRNGEELRMLRERTLGGAGEDRRGRAFNERGLALDGVERQKKDGKGEAGEFDDYSRIQIKAWDPNTPYIAAMKAVKPEQAYDVYFAQREKFAKSPAFYLDCADYLLRNGQKEAGIRVLTDVVELKLEDARLIRIAAHRLQQIGEFDLAINLFERVSRLRPEEPQSFRDLALALAARADMMNTKHANSREDKDTGRIASDYARAIELLNKVVTSNWDRFPEIEVIALMEANQVLAKLQAIPNLGDIPIALDPRLRKNLDLDVRVVLTWDADMTDVDLWVTEPSGEKCMYNHNRTVIGGLVSRDFTQGYGPEEYCLRKAMPGQYTIQANFYGSRQQELAGACTVQATVITNFGRPNEHREPLTLRLTNQKDMITIGTVTLGKDGAKATPTTQPAVEFNK